MGRQCCIALRFRLVLAGYEKVVFYYFLLRSANMAPIFTMKTKLDILTIAAKRKSIWLTRCKVPKCDLIASQEMYDTGRKFEDNLEMY